MATNAETEMAWVNAWEELVRIVADRPDMPCQLPDWSVVDVETCKGWLQQAVYEGYQVSVQAGYVGHRQGVIVTRWRPGENVEA